MKKEVEGKVLEVAQKQCRVVGKKMQLALGSHTVKSFRFNTLFL